MKKFLNPFEYIAGWQALAIGAAGLLATAAVATLTGQSFNAFMHIWYADIAFWQALAQQLVCWLIFSTLLYVAARIFSHSRVRALDIYGTNLFARIPLLPMLAAVCIPGRSTFAGISAQSTVEELQQQFALGLMLVYGILAIAFLVWFYWWSYKAFAVSANLKGNRALVVFVTCYIVASYAVGPILIKCLQPHIFTAA